MTRYQPLLFDEPIYESLEKIVVFDLETTGLRPKKDEIIQIAAAKLIRGKFIKRETFHTFVRPLRSIPPEITEFTGIKRSHVRNAPRIKAALAEFSEFCEDATLVGHNCHAFDFPFIRNACSKIACPTREISYFDSMHISWQVWGRYKTYHSLDDVIRRCSVSSARGKRHDGRGDVRLLVGCIQKMFSHITRKNKEYQVKLYSGILPHLK